MDDEEIETGVIPEVFSYCTDVKDLYLDVPQSNHRYDEMKKMIRAIPAKIQRIFLSAPNNLFMRVELAPTFTG